MYDCIIIGAGPSGLMCASQINNKKVLIIEKNDKPGKKLMLTGNGRCNITNLKANNLFLEQVYNKKYMYSSINTFGPREIYHFFIENNVPLKEETDNKVFPTSNKAIDILNALKRNNLHEIKYNEQVLSITSDKTKTITTNKAIYQTKIIVIATGGASYPQTGSTGDHMKFAKQIKQKTIKLTPKEVGIILDEKTNLEGVSLTNVTIYYKKAISTGNLIFTKNGISASAIMNISGKINLENDNIIKIDLLPNEKNLSKALEEFDREKEIESFLNKYFPKRLSIYLTTKQKIEKRPIKTLSKAEKNNLVYLIKNIELRIKSFEDLSKAFITGGGIDMHYIDSKTMQSTINPGIYFIGESLDIDGPIGGYNLTLALSTGYVAGHYINQTINK